MLPALRSSSSLRMTCPRISRRRAQRESRAPASAWTGCDWYSSVKIVTAPAAGVEASVVLQSTAQASSVVNERIGARSLSSVCVT